MSDPRLSTLSAAFRNTKMSIGGKEVRRPSPITVDLMVESGNPLFSGEEGEILTDQDAMRGVMEFAWLHTAPLEEVANLPLDPAELTAAIRHRGRMFGLTVDFEDLAAFSTQFSALRERLEAAATETTGGPPPTPGKPEETPPTGLPAWSMPSAEQATPSANTGSSGSSPSSAPSNTSTPPMSTMAAPAAGNFEPLTSPAEIDPMPMPPS